MSKWNKSQGVIVPLESLIKERRKENCPAPRRSAGLVGRWGITSFTSIRSRNYVAEYNNVDLKDPTGLELGSGDSPESMVNLLGSNASEPARPRKFFKSRNTLPPPPPPQMLSADHAGQQHSPYAGGIGAGMVYGGPPSGAELWNRGGSATTTTPPQAAQNFYQPLSAGAATPQFSPTGPQSANVGLIPAGAHDGMAYAVQLHPQLPLGTSKEKTGRKKKRTAVAATLVMDPSVPFAGVDVPTGRKATNKAAKKEKKEKRTKKTKKDTPVGGTEALEQPKRNSSRIRNRVVNYNEEEDSNDDERSVARHAAGNHHLPPASTPEYSGIALPVDTSFAGMLGQQQQQMLLHQHQDPLVTTAAFHSTHGQASSPVAAGCSGVESGGEGRSNMKPSTTTVVTPLPSPTISEHRPILLRISKGTSMLISTDSEEVSTNSTPPTAVHSQPLCVPDQRPQEEDEDDFECDQLPPRLLLAGSESSSVDHSDTAQKLPYRQYLEQLQQQDVAESSLHTTQVEPAPSVDVTQQPPKTELKIKISLVGKPLISSTTSSARSTTPSGLTKGTKGTRYNFKKRAIERERARSHLPSKRTKADLSEGNPEGRDAQSPGHGVSAPVSSTVPKLAPNQKQHQLSTTSVTDKPCPSVARPSFPLPGTDTYEVFRTLSSLSGGDDFDSQSSILGSASSDNTPKHTLAPGEDCQIIHSRGSSDCGSDLELSQNSSTAAAPPSDVYSESENTQDNNRRLVSDYSQQPVPNRSFASSTTPSSSYANEAASIAPVSSAQHEQAGGERVEVLKLNLKNVGTRVTRNKMKHTGSDEQQPTAGKADQSTAPETESPSTRQLLLRVGRNARNRSANTTANNNNNVVESTVSEKRPRKVLQMEQATPTLEEDTKNSIRQQTADDGVPALPQHSKPEPTLPEPPAIGQKPNITRQYSRRKKNVVPPDYAGSEQTVDSGESKPGVSQETTPEGRMKHNGDYGSGASVLDQQVTSCSGLIVPGDESITQTVASTGQATVGTSAGPPPPMRLVLQKKGTIFKSRPMVGTSDGATDTKKRHVYKHKWDNDNGNGMMDQEEQPVGAGGVGAGGDAGIVGNGASGTAGGGAGAGKVLDGLSSGLADGRDDGTGEGVDGSGTSSGGGLGPGGSGVNLLDYDGDFDGEAPSVGGIPLRSKRVKMISSVVSGASGSSGIAFGAGSGAGSGSGASHFGSFGGGVGPLRGHHRSAADGYDGEDGFDDENGSDEYGPARMRCDRAEKPFYTIVRNVKNSHQMQEIGEFQEMDDDVDYILSALHPDNPCSTRCLSALQLATKCMKPAFKMHVRAHGVVTRFFRALSDAHEDASLGLCTAAIMYVFSQDKLNMDLDRDSLELMLNLLDTDHKLDGAQQQGQLQKIRQRVKELCEEIKSAGKAKHIDTDRVTAGSLAMESLLSLTSQRAGEWFKDELRVLGGIEHLIKTVNECYEQVPSRARDWTEPAVAKLRKIERCLRVLNNVTLFNPQNQSFLLEHRAGLLVQILVKLYRQVDSDLMHYPTDDTSPKESIGVLLRELLQPMLHMLITLTHSFDEEAHGAHLVGKQPDVINITMHLLLRIAEYVPHRFVFDLHLLALTLLLHLARPSQLNRQQVLRYMDPETNRGGIKALVEYFEQQEEMASHAEAKTNAILETPARTVDAEDAETKLIQKAEHHMEHTYMGSHVCMLICQLVVDEPGYEQIARMHLKNNNFKRMVVALSRYYEFLNLTTNADAESTTHKRQTKEAIDYLNRLDGCEAGVTRGASSDAMTASLCQ
ncbi:protein wings apart-like [Anopheles nili]|uniref:protein wings apart-like n=1 Tax=Anopheles nili TaxID=185578 RepID=UPI00237C35A3|nr:protein wings apart-like [Anopheles nili]